MSLVRRIRRLVQLDLDAYFLFRTQLTANATKANGVGGTDADISFALLDKNSGDSEALEGLKDAMQSASFLSADQEKAKAALTQRLRNGDACVVALADHQIIGFAWIAGQRSDVYNRFAACAKKMCGAAVLYQAYVSPSFRGQGLHIQMDRTRKNYLRAADISQSLTFVGIRNFASIRNSMRENDQYKLIYNLVVKGPRGLTLNFYPKWAKEPWAPCKQESAIRSKNEGKQ